MEIIEIIVIVLLALLANCLLVQVLYHCFMFIRLAIYKNPTGEPASIQAVSVIIAARNEYDNLEKHLELILEQNHPKFEVVVINDCSWDQTATLLERLQIRYSHLKVVTLLEQEKYPKGKKFALTLGIKASEHELLVFTDADCKPASNMWLRNMQTRFTPNKHLVLGYSPYKKQSGLLNMFIRFETFMTGISYLSFALLKDAYMGVGRNLAYRKSLFFTTKGFASHNHLLSGDDDLFVNETANQGNVAIEIRKDSFMVSEPKENWASWRKQKSRHMSTGKYYKGRHQFWLGVFSVSHILFNLSLILLVPFIFIYIDGVYVHYDQLLYMMAGAYGFRLLVQLCIYYPNMKKLNDTQLIFLLPVLDLMYSFYLFAFGLASLFSKPKTWS